MKKLVLLLFLGLMVFSCGTKRVAIRKKETRKKSTERVVIPKTTNEPSFEEAPTSTVSSKVINSTEDYLAVFSDIAQEEMRLYGIPASITLAQGILESGSGKGRLSVEANNHFGIKCHDWTGDRIYHDDDALQECFRKYVDAKYSFRDHSLFLTTRKRYADLFELRKNDYKGWAKGLKAAGYATDRKYPDKLISLIERYELYKLDTEVLSDQKAYSDEPATKKNESVVYFVTKGDTLYSISKKYSMTVKELQEINGLNGTTISIGQALKVKPTTKNY